MTQNYHLASNEQLAMRATRYLRDYSNRVMGEPLSNNLLTTVASDFISDVLHLASFHGGCVSKVLSTSLGNYLAEISVADAPEETMNQLQAIVDDAIYEATIGTP
jgi:hypothetical protein